MLEKPQISGDTKDGVIVLTINYDEEQLLKKGKKERFSNVLTNEYENFRKNVDNPSCIVKIESEVAGSAIIRALFELWKRVHEKEKGKVICVDYPKDYINSLSAIGLTALSGFKLASTVEKAINKIKK